MYTNCKRYFKNGILDIKKHKDIEIIKRAHKYIIYNFLSKECKENFFINYFFYFDKNYIMRINIRPLKNN